VGPVRRRLLSLVIAVGVAPIAVLATSATASPVKTVGRFLPAHQHQVLPMHNADTSSLNWSGYAVTGTNITRVTSSYIVPTVNNLPPGFTANWAGIGGYSSSDLIQAGTGEDTLDGYYAWYEILPDSETLLTDCTGDAACTVNPGDHMTIDINKVGANLWSVSLTDGNNWSWQRNISYQSSESSAEWILEAPTVVVQTVPANVGQSYFGATSTFAVNGGASQSIASGGPISIAMGPGLVNEATPSGLAPNGESFNVCTYKQSCPTPAG
jgi:hypothetical protein